jgi:inhibitor of cysteine peptidase
MSEIGNRKRPVRLCRRLFVFALIAVFALGAGTAAAARVVSVGTSANGKSLELKRGDTLVVRLDANPTTGYDWAIVGKPKCLRLVGRSFVAPPPGLVGAGGKDVFRFSAKKGRGKLQLVYRRSWEKGKPPLRSFALTIRTG